MCMNISSRKQKAQAELKNDILVAASQLFREKGFLAVSVSDVASQVGISKSNIYNYFRNKNYLLYEVLSIAAQDLIAKAHHILASSASPKDKLEGLVKLQMQIVTDKDRGFGGISVFERRSLPVNLRKRYDLLRDKYEQLFRSVLEEAVAAGQIRQCDTKLMSLFILGLINSIPHWYKQTGPLSAEDVTNEIWKLLTCGIIYKAELETECKRMLVQPAPKVMMEKLVQGEVPDES